MKSSLKKSIHSKKVSKNIIISELYSLSAIKKKLSHKEFHKMYFVWLNIYLRQ